MTKPIPKPTVASLQRELAAAERRAQDAERERLKTLDHSVVLAEERDAAKALAAGVRPESPPKPMIATWRNGDLLFADGMRQDDIQGMNDRVRDILDVCDTVGDSLCGAP